MVNKYPTRRHTWTIEEEDRLRQLYLGLDKKSLLKEFPNTTWNTIQTKACELGITGKRKDWIEQEMDTLRKMYPQYPLSVTKNEILSMLPGRSWQAVLRKAMLFNVSCVWIWTEEENKILEANYPKCTRKEIEKLLPHRDWESISSQSYRLGLHQNRKKFGPGYRWGQHKALDIIGIILGEEAVRDRRYHWMKSPKGYPLEIDGYYPNHNLAVEFQGQHHFCDGFLGRGVEYQQTCDQIKREAIKVRGIQLLEIKYDEPLTEEHLRNRLEELGVFSHA